MPNRVSLALLALLAACAGYPGSTFPLGEESIAAIQVNRTTRAEVRELLGPPSRIDQFPRMEREIWTYRVYSRPLHKELYVQFSPDGVVRESYLVPDPEELSRSMR